MGSNGLVTVVKGKRVVAKITAGDNGKKAKDVAEAIVEHLNGVNVDLLRTIAEAKEFGCEACLTIVCRDDEGPGIRIFYAEEGMSFPAYPSNDPSTLTARYVKTLDIRNFNARWSCGTASYGWLANLDTGKVTPMRYYRGVKVE